MVIKTYRQAYALIVQYWHMMQLSTFNMDVSMQLSFRAVKTFAFLDANCKRSVKVRTGIMVSGTHGPRTV